MPSINQRVSLLVSKRGAPEGGPYTDCSDSGLEQNFEIVQETKNVIWESLESSVYPKEKRALSVIRKRFLTRSLPETRWEESLRFFTGLLARQIVLMFEETQNDGVMELVVEK